ncbi:uncharacterized protein C8Q71DRAFT_857194 [Rhodofomes roseus]|uniref:Uncharacterized protein n=1 Tax=Rhodofomes roseus TaxID=34475 RepID=A0ABQ8KKB1_9APHY|nr:uncharacterized protein C8Q71DRAFT_857194 [Rhodofomes roseus]KAH9838027.1 hypothetical protein C8Q71DRAFT_857194 [Rhodofomes roseus]
MDNSNWQQSQNADRYSDQGTGQGSTYDSMQGGQQQGGQQPQRGMGGGQGAFGSGVAGGYGSNNSQGQQNQQGQGQQGQGQQGAEKQDWLDKGIEALGNKVGHNVNDKQADSAGDFLNKQFNKYSGRNLPGVQ